ncbi:hypothetical protein SJI19_21795 [Acerihabitans sp. TG2]|uniref:hypothetical protein n=1 Tax=Acerihabitans sp. TG2 TaxID=3096008 RepID=UPI002B225CC1|nr:hypothetical protein [Acerihabitans sp. TG2]MEA9393137.1 hypothetical protein [Acerihabitans sp. TG2]
MNFKLYFFKFISVFVFGFFIFNYIASFINLKTAPIPWIFITLLLFPFGFCASALYKLSESDEHSSLTSSELRRLRPIIEIKKKRLLALIIYYFLSALIVALGLFSLPENLSIYKYFIPVCGGLILSSLYSFFYISSVMDEIQQFRSKLIHRVEDEKRRKELLESLTKKADH